VWKPLAEQGDDYYLDESSFTKICDEEECVYREKIKKQIMILSKEHNLPPAMGVFSMIPISMELALEHINVKNFREAIRDYVGVVEMYLGMLKSKSMEMTIKSAIEAEENNFDW
jgi:hypothetical protein